MRQTSCSSLLWLIISVSFPRVCLCISECFCFEHFLVKLVLIFFYCVHITLFFLFFFGFGGVYVLFFLFFLFIC